jgi:phage terminase Nu1 subunit (DNA packaging protein)
MPAIMSLSDPDRYLQRSGLAQLLKRSPRTIDRYREQGLPCFEEFGRVWFDRQEVDAWLAARVASAKKERKAA